jgi:uncharacterized protein YgfB (UPF0149 family)
MSYSDIQKVLQRARAATDAAEAHGTLTGCLCAVVPYRFEDWLVEILPDGGPDSDASARLLELYKGTEESLISGDLRFELLLPEDELPLDTRASALGEWCQGFLYGLGSGALSDAAKLPGDVGEIVRDLSEITRVGVDGGETLESNENAYTELVEFVRVGVQLVFEELGSFRIPAKPSGAALH